MRHNLQEVMSKHWVIRDFTKAKHGRLSEVDHEPEEKQRRVIRASVSKSNEDTFK